MLKWVREGKNEDFFLNSRYQLSSDKLSEDLISEDKVNKDTLSQMSGVFPR